MSDKIELLPCPFCGNDARLESNRDWHRIIVDHDEQCIFIEPEVVMVPATDEQISIAIADWNRRAAIAQQPAPAVPEGWKLVPIKPTDAMIDAAYNCYWMDCLSSIYHAMLYAAPAAPVAQGQWPSGCPCNSAPGPCENCSPAAEQPDTVAVPRELLEILLEEQISALGHTNPTARKTQFLLAGGEA